jgi:hypothetical protein
MQHSTALINTYTLSAVSFVTTHEPLSLGFYSAVPVNINASTLHGWIKVTLPAFHKIYFIIILIFWSVK